MRLILKILLILASVILLLIGVFYIWGDEIISTKLENTVSRATKGTYEAGVNGIRLNIFPLGVKFSELEIHPVDSNNPAAIQLGDTALVVDATIGSASITGVSLVQLLFKDTVSINNVDVEDLNLKVLADEKSKPVELEKKGNSSKTLILQEVSLKNLMVSFLQRKNDSTYIVLETNIAATVRNLNFSESVKKNLPKFEVTATNTAYYSQDRLYRFSLEKLTVSSDEGYLQADSFTVKPLLPKGAFSKAKGKQTDRIDLTCKQLICRKADVEKLIGGKQIKMEKIAIDELDAEFYRDRRQPRKGHKTKPLPHEMLHSLGMGVKVDSLVLQRSSFTYQEVNPDGDKAGEIVFANFDGRVTEINNIAPKRAVINVNTDIYNAGHLHAVLHIPMTGDSLYQVNAALDTMEAVEFNKILMDVAFLKFESGEIKDLDIRFTHNLTTATGELKMVYKNLELETHSSGNKDVSLTDKAQVLAANLFVLNNPNTVVTGKIDVERDRERSILNLWWKAVLSGLKSLDEE